MKKIFVFGTISLFLLAVVLSGCQNISGKAYATTAKKPNVGKLIAWEQDKGYDNIRTIYAEFFDKYGQPINSEFELNGVNSKNPKVDVCSDGSSIIAWEQIQNDGTTRVWAEFFDKYGQPINSEFELQGVDSSNVVISCS